jgi:hypothetical protein
MPNWCMNQLKIEHDDPAMIQRFVKAFNEERTCSEFLPMPEDPPGGWFDWCVENWGTKWDFGTAGGHCTAEGTKFACSFSTAWAPPVGLYGKLHDLGYRVDATYFEPGMSFCGVWQDGTDECISYSSKEMIPVRIWREFECEEWFDSEEPVTPRDGR